MEYLNINSFETKRSVTIDSLKTHFLPIQEGEGDPSPDNVRPITGWNSIKVRKCGKNLAKIVGYSAQANNSSTDLRRLTNIYGTTISTTEYVSGNDKLVITQTVQPDDYAITSYRHGYVAIILDGLLYGKKYNFSFKVSDIVSNPLNATLDQMIETSPGSTHYDPIVTEDNHIIFKNRWFTRHGTIPNRCSIEIRNCGMSFTLSEFMVTAVEDEDFTYEPYREEEVEVELHGKNLVPSIDEWQDGYINGNGTISSPDNNQNEKYCNFIKASPNTTYIFSFSLTNIPSRDLWACIATYDKDKNLIRRYSYNPSLGTESYQSIITEENCNYIACSFRTFNMVNWVQLEKIEVNEVLNKKSKWVDGYISNNPSVPVSPDATRKEITSDFIDIGLYNANKVGFYYSFNNVPPDNNWVGVVFCDENKSYLSRPTKFPGTNLISINGFFEIPEDARYIRFSFRSYGDVKNISVFLCNDSNVTYEPYTNTFYGGYVDIAKGELVQEYTAISAKLSDCTRKVTYEENDPNSGMVWYDFQPFVDFGITNNNKQMSTICKYSYNLADRKINHFYMYTMQPSGRTRLLLFFTEEDDQPEDFEFTVVGQLVTPIHYPIPPETLKTLRGFNTIFSTGNDSIEVGYSELSPMSLLELRRSIIASEPHLVTVETGNTEDSDVIASFKTNTALPIKSMVTNFEPKQEGEGDPSPDNIRPITGLSELEIHNYPHLVQWNQWLQPLTEENWNPYDANNISVAFSDGVITSEWLVDITGGYATAVRNKAIIPNPEGHIWYVSYMVRHHAQGIKHFGVEFAGGRQIRAIVTAEPDVWYQVSTVGSWYKNSNQYVYISNVNNGEEEIGLIVESKSPVYIDLTRMYGAGNEPTKEEFEAQCALNGIDLTTYNPYDEGTVIPWRMSADEDRIYQIPLTLPNLITPEPKSITSYNVDFTVNEDGTVDYEGTPTSYAGVVVGFYYPKGGETITVTICGDNANICFNAVQIYYDNKWNNPYPALEGKKTYTLDLSEFPDASIVRIALKRMSNSVYMKGKCWVRVVEGTVDTGDEVFGGYIDLENNEFVKTWECIGLDSLNWSIFTANTTTYPDAIPIFYITSLEKDISTKAKDWNNGITWYVSGLQSIWRSWGTNITLYSAKNYPEYDKDLSFTITQSGSKGYLAIRADQFDNVADLKRFLQGKKVAYPKEVPVHFQLSPTVIRTFKGINNIYTNANGKSTIKYWTH